MQPFRSRPAPTRRKRPTFLTREEIIEAAAAILERDGYDALNMRSIAAELAVQPAALYRHIDNRGDLDDLLFDHLMEGCAPAVSGVDWRADARTIAGAWRARLLERRDMTRIALGQISFGPNIAPLTEVALLTLRRAGLRHDEILVAYRTLTVFIHSFATAEASYRSLGAQSGEPGARPAPAHPEWAASFPTLSEFADDLSEQSRVDACFAFALEALIAAIERQAAIAG